MTVSELARQEGFALSTASLLVTQLAEAGLVERHEDADGPPADGRLGGPGAPAGERAVLDSKLAPLRRALRPAWDRAGRGPCSTASTSWSTRWHEIRRHDDDRPDALDDRPDALTTTTLQPPEEHLS